LRLIFNLWAGVIECVEFLPFTGALNKKFDLANAGIVKADFKKFLLCTFFFIF
jgi:hypothetical protein